jgi:hypothetical protein
MTRHQLHQAIAARTGEPLAVIRHLGFGLLREARDEPPADAIRLVLHCPFCRGQVPYPGRARDGSNALAECDVCDVYFEFDDREVFPASAPTAAPRPMGSRPIPA